MYRRCVRFAFAHRKYTHDKQFDPFGEKTGWDGPLVTAAWQGVNVEALNSAAATDAVAHTHFGPEWARSKHILRGALASVAVADLPDSPSDSIGREPAPEFSAAVTGVIPPPLEIEHEVVVVNTKPTEDPKGWSPEEVHAWIRSHIEEDTDMACVEEILEAMSLIPVNGKLLLELNPPNLFKEMRRSHLQKDKAALKISLNLLQETVLLSFRYGGANSPWK